jgi:predicted ATPase/class 3 adenylate cyclase
MGSSEAQKAVCGRSVQGWWPERGRGHDVAMGVLPSGTVTLLFSDIEGSTVLLSRLGDAYADALDGQRRVLRKAWADYGGTEMGTEGDSFFVVFSSAEGAVAAAAQAQRDLAAFEWPGGESVRVRMGVHTGTPRVHDGGYVGMDVHRAARIAGSAHGGQVVVSSATAELVAGCLPDQVALRDLGSHQLKDIPQSEHLFQLAIDGLPQDFPALRTLGAASRLPRPATPLVGRDGELAEVTAALSSPDVALVTLTGPGGSGKTRLAIAVAHRLVPTFWDGVYFVALAAVTSPDAMWTSIAETLDAPPEALTPPALFAHVAHRRALLVLDNLEQLPGADRVVADLLDAAPSIRVLATSRRPLHLPGEQEHPVPPLELPESSEVAEASASGAVQMFVQQARLVRPGFAVTADNAADVAAVCRRLDGLPLAIELAATRSKLLSPHALLARLDTALDLAASGSTVQRRQKTLRDTIAWSYELLNPPQQVFFLRLGVFAGGADLEAVAAVAQRASGPDALNLVADLADASLIIVGEDGEGEPRVFMLETIRAFALDELRRSGEADVRRAHGVHYLSLVQRWHGEISAGGTERVLRARRQFEPEVNNVRAALTWALLQDEPDPPTADRAQLGLRLCAAACLSWWEGGYFIEARRWLTRAIDVGPGADSRELGLSLAALAAFETVTGNYRTARAAALRGVEILRRIDDKADLPFALSVQGRVARALEDHDEARRCFQEAIDVSRDAHDRHMEAEALKEMALQEFLEGNLERRLELELAAVALYQDMDDDYGLLSGRWGLACTFRLLGRLDQARLVMAEVVPLMVTVGNPEERTSLAEDYAALLVDLGQNAAAARLIGAADARREQDGTRRNTGQEAELAKAFADVRTALPADAWHREYQSGRAMTVEDALAAAHARQSAGPP